MPPRPPAPNPAPPRVDQDDHGSFGEGIKLMFSKLLGDEGLFYWRDAFTPLTVRCWKRERHGIMSTSWSGWRLFRVFGWRVALIQKGPW